MAKNIIKLNRGDSYEFGVPIGEISDKDAIYFALLYPHQRFEDAILINGYTLEDVNLETGDVTIKILPKDTACLVPGVYYYTVKLHQGSTSDVMDILNNPVEVRTIIERTKFIIND